jgi:2-oxoglutarate ferredoxin oxidoreductase subunit beta
MALAISQGATFVAQGFSADLDHLADLIVRGTQHKGFALINIFQPCVTFNPTVSYAWYRERVYKLPVGYDATNTKIALEKSLEFENKIPTGVIYKQDRPIYTDGLPQLQSGTLVDSDLSIDLTGFISEFE